MVRVSTAIFGIAGAALLAAGSVAAHPTGTVNVQLEDPSTGAGIHAMKMTATAEAVRAGKVTIHVTNESKALVHELLVLKQPAGGKSLPYDAKADRVIESKVVKLADSGDMTPGMSKTMTVSLRQGRYLLICNQPGHYHAGMSKMLMVTP